MKKPQDFYSALVVLPLLLTACSGQLASDPDLGDENGSPAAAAGQEDPEFDTSSSSSPESPTAAGGDGIDERQDEAAPSSGDRPGAEAAEPTEAGETAPQTSPGEAGNPSVSPTTFTCDTSEAVTAPAWRRLTQQQYSNTIDDMLLLALGELGPAMVARGELEAALSAIPSDERPLIAEDLRGTYRRLDQTVSQAHVDNWYEVGVAAGAVLTTPDTIETVVGECAWSDSDVATCLDGFVRGFGERALRRPLSDEEVSFYADFYGSPQSADPAGYADVIAGLLNAPQFLYIIEHGSSSDEDDGSVALTPFELATRLSYHFWNTMPDDELWSAARDGSLQEPAVYEAQVDRLLNDDRAREAAADFYREWLKLENLPHLDQANGLPIFQTFAGADLPSFTLRDNMMDEVVALVQHLSWDEPSGFDELLTTQLLFPRTEDLANIYGVSPSEEPVAAPNDERPGLLTRAAFLSTGSANTRPIRKGVFIRENILCDHIPPPPDNAAAATPELSSEMTTREVVEALTEDTSTACAGCHQTLINPLGFATENYDALGRLRSEQALFDEDGNVVGAKDVDTSSVPRVVTSDDTEISSTAELMSLIQDSGKAHACFARHYFRYTFGRWEDVLKDGCALEQMRSALVDSGSLSGMLRQVALTPEFQTRVF